MGMTGSKTNRQMENSDRIEDNMMNGKENKEEAEYERCIICGCITQVRRDWDISMRKYYVEGAGQLCKRCFYDIYG